MASLSSEAQDFFRLQEINRALIEENVQLKNQLAYYSMLTDTSDGNSIPRNSDTLYNYYSGKVVRVTYNRMKNQIVINRGGVDGIEPEMAIITPQGVVGLVQHVTEHYSIVIPLINVDSRTSAKIKNNNYNGSVQWDGADCRYSYLKDIPYHVSVSQGDTIVTSGYSSIFPEGLTIGTVESVHREGANFLSIKILLAVEFRAMTHVYIIRNKQKAEREQLEEYYSYE